MKKKTIAVIFGGLSSEYSVSLSSASAVLNHLDPQKYEIVPIGITAKGDWYRYNGDYAHVEDDTWHTDIENLVKVVPSPDRSLHGIVEFYAETHDVNPKAEMEIRLTAIDAVFPVLHGKNGEDGTLQGLFELAGIPIIGCGTLSSAVCMHKGTAHELIEHAGIDVPKAVLADRSAGVSAACELVKKLSFPVFVKPVRSGSSIGVTKVNSDAELATAIALAFEYDDQAIVEEFIAGFEVGCAVMGVDELVTGRVDEIEMQSEFFDFTEKYTLKHSQIHMPARIDEATEKRIQETAKRIYRTLGCRVLARVDSFLTADGRIVFNEVNTIPGFTAHSRFPNMMKGIGLSFGEMLDQLITIGLEE
ncbi:MAG: D-alanine--D-serine ligase VanG [Clostridiales Family XIII bacterium]|nr:D-alanine--D-serine ligase VanG [Clostridiales Family XIII bacterium]